MKRHLQNLQGSLMTSLIGATLVASVAYFFLSGMISSNKQIDEMKETFQAQLYASELLELLRSHSAAKLKGNLSVNPINPAFSPYYLCSHINILNRQDGTLRNNHSLADLPENSLDGSLTSLKANRFYLVEVIDISTSTVRKNICNKTAKDIYLYGATPQSGETVGLSKYERFLVTVGVSWVPNGKPISQAKRVVLTSVIP